MNHKKIEQQIIQNYKSDERMMILVYAQWCINQNLDPVELYKKAYPDQLNNDALIEALKLTVPKNESDEIANQTVLNVLQLFGNDHLASVVQSEMNQLKENKS